MGAASSAIGLGSIFGGIFLQGADASRRRQQLLQIANEIQSFDIGAQETKNLEQNKALLPGAKELGSDINQFNQDEQLKSLRESIPGYDELVKSQLDLTNSRLRGEIPTDVAGQIQRYTAGRNISGGYGKTSQFGNNLLARDLGLTSLGLQNQGFEMAGNYLNQMRSLTNAPKFDVTSQFMSATQRVAFEFQKLNMQTQAELYAVNAPTEAGIWGQNMQQYGNMLLASGMGGRRRDGGGGGGGFDIGGTELGGGGFG